MQRLEGTTVLVAVLVLAGCASVSAQSSPPATVCTVAAAQRNLPAEVRETSGLARGVRNADVFWTHNDSGNESVLYALSADGAIKARVQLRGAELSDWEDIEGGPCGSGYCLYLADTGDNAGRRKHISIYEVAEPGVSDTQAPINRVVHASYPDGAQDAEALFRLPNGDLYVVTKGRQQTIKLYKVSPAGTNGQGTLQLIRQLSPQPGDERDRVTAATASPDGNWVAIRTYATLFIYRTKDLLEAGNPVITESLTPLAEKQGESLTLDNDGTVWMTSEAERNEDLPTMTAVRCPLPR